MPLATTIKGFLGGSLRRSNYAYANARVRVRKSKLISRETYPKLLKMDIAEITRVLEGTSYGKEIDELAVKFSGGDLLDGALNVNEERDYAEIRSFVQGEVQALVGRYLERWIHWNIKTILRGRGWGAKPEEILRELLIEDRANFEFYNGLIHAEGSGAKAVVESLGATAEGRPYQRILREAERGTTDPGQLLQSYEDALDRSYFENLLATISPSSRENTVFLQFVRKEIDARNVELLLRAKSRPEGGPKDLAGSLLPAGYELKAADLRRLSETTSRDELVEQLKPTKLYQEIKEELDAVSAGKSLSPVSVALTRAVAEFAQRFAYLNPLSVLPIINYLMRKNLEVRNIRAIARGKTAGLSEAEIEGLLVVI